MKTSNSREAYPKQRKVYPKMLIARTHHLEYQYEGIKIVDLTEWLFKSNI